MVHHGAIQKRNCLLAIKLWAHQQIEGTPDQIKKLIILYMIKHSLGVVQTQSHAGGDTIVIIECNARKVLDEKVRCSRQNKVETVKVMLEPGIMF